MTIDDIVPMILGNLQSGFQLRPVVYAEIEGRAAPREFGLLRMSGGAREQAIIQFDEGRAAGRRARDERLVRIVYASEIWATEGQRNPTPGQRPPASVPHKDGLLVALIEASSPFAETYRMYEIKRGKKGQAVEFVNLHAEGGSGLNGGLAWVCGWYSRRLDDRAVQALQPRGMRAFLQLDPNAPRAFGQEGGNHG